MELDGQPGFLLVVGSQKQLLSTEERIVGVIAILKYRLPMSRPPLLAA